jgi:hypothetical protein
MKLMINTMNDGTWRKSSLSAHNGGCVEVRQTEDGGVEVRDTKDRSKAPHAFTRGEWDAFLGGARNGEFDLA